MKRQLYKLYLEVMFIQRYKTATVACNTRTGEGRFEHRSLGLTKYKLSMS